jgi:hypothetical protein
MFTIALVICFLPVFIISGLDWLLRNIDADELLAMGIRKKP